MHREVGHSNMLHIVRNIRDNMEFLELPGGGTHQPFSDARRGGRTQVDEAEDDALWPHSKRNTWRNSPRGGAEKEAKQK